MEIYLTTGQAHRARDMFEISTNEASKNGANRGREFGAALSFHGARAASIAKIEHAPLSIEEQTQMSGSVVTVDDVVRHTHVLHFVAVFHRHFHTRTLPRSQRRNTCA